MNLLTKLNEKFKNIKDETKKRITATILAGGIALSGLGMAGCNNTTKDPGNTNPPIITPGGDETGGSQNGNPQTPDYSKYSQILQNVLTDQYYKNLIIDDLSSSFKRAYNHQAYQPIPYGFLEDEGFDVEKYKNQELSCASELYSIGNDIFIEVKAEIQASTNYMANYVLKYNLTDKEMNELNKLFVSLDYSHGYATYHQAPFFIQELSYLKEPEVKSVGYITKASLNSIIDKCNAEKYLANDHIVTYTGSEYHVQDNLAYHNFQIRPYPFRTKSHSEIANIKILSLGISKFENNSHIVLNSLGGYLAEEFNSITITSYTTGNHYLQDIQTNGDFNKVLGN